jgi:hypothetical protein
MLAARGLFWRLLGGWSAAAALLIAAALATRSAFASKTLCSDFLCYWTGAKILASGQSPYDTELQAGIQQEHGWDAAASGLGIYRFLPYYYPPWLGLAWMSFLPLGYTTAKAAWFWINVGLAVGTGYLLRDAVPGLPRWLPAAVVLVFLFTLICLALGQTVVLILFLTVAAWRLLQARWDRSAGVALVWLTIKPQLAVVVLLGVLLWAARQRRWGVVGAFLITLTLLCLVSTWVVPSWPAEMLNAARETPPPTEYYPWIGTTWYCLLRTLDLSGWALGTLYLAVALPVVGAVVRTALDRSRPPGDVVAVSTLASFLIAPYARHYDFPVLLLPLFLLLDRRLSALVGASLLTALVALPYAQLVFLYHLKEIHGPVFKWHGELTFFWVPLLLTAAWFLTDRRRKRQAPHGGVSPPALP